MVDERPGYLIEPLRYDSVFPMLSTRLIPAVLVPERIVGLIFKLFLHKTLAFQLPGKRGGFGKIKLAAQGVKSYRARVFHQGAKVDWRN